MRKNYFLIFNAIIVSALNLLIFACINLQSFNSMAQGGGAAINKSGVTADPSAILDVSSTNYGILIPRMTEAQKNLISTPATGLMIYQTDGSAGFWYYNGTTWMQSLGLTGATGPTGITGATGFLASGSSAGNTPYWDGSQWVVSSSNIYNNGGSVGIGTNTPDASAAIDIYSITKGALIPRMSNAQKNAITNPAEGLQVYNTSTKCLELYVNTAWEKIYCGCSGDISFRYRGSIVTYGTVVGENHSNCWLDRNLGASQVATAYNDALSYGDYFQWGRKDDGHQVKNSTTTTTLSTSDVPGHSNFIQASSSPNDWRNPQNNVLWQGAYSINNPCPSGWRLPTYFDFGSEQSNWSSLDYNGAFASSLKLPVSGNRRGDNGLMASEGTGGYLWSSTTSSTYAIFFGYSSSAAGTNLGNRTGGLGVRCIRD